SGCTTKPASRFNGRIAVRRTVFMLAELGLPSTSVIVKRWCHCEALVSSGSASVILRSGATKDPLVAEDRVLAASRNEPGLGATDARGKRHGRPRIHPREAHSAWLEI